MELYQWFIIGGQVALLLVFIGGFLKVTKNELKHLGDDITEIKNDVKELRTCDKDLSDRVSKLEGREGLATR